MKRFAITAVCGFLSFLPSGLGSVPEGNVILITLDGVRYHEIFQGIRRTQDTDEAWHAPIIPDTLGIIRDHGFAFGDRVGGEPRMVISNRSGLSQPGYFAILTGQFEPNCRSNRCPTIDRETIIDRLLDEGVPSKRVATFASWNVIDRCIESKGRRAVRSIAFDPIEGLSPDEAAPYIEIQERANRDRPTRWGNSRWDRLTFEMGIRYLREQRPRFLYLSFVEPDEYAHLDDYPGYVQSLRDFDARFLELVRTLKTLGEYGRETSIVVTTDHGRGRGFLWRKHSREWFDSRRIWALVLPSEGIRARTPYRAEDRCRYRQSDVRPTIEVLLGLSPRTGRHRGDPLIAPIE